jgi:uncharacterized Tic20 family protein
VKNIYRNNLIFIFVFTLILVLMFWVFRNSEAFRHINKFILNESPKDKFKDLLSVLLTVFSVLVGFMATIGTLFIGLTEKRTVKFITFINKGDLLRGTINLSIYSGILLILLMGIQYFLIGIVKKIEILQFFIIVLTGAFIIFSKSSMTLLKLINITLEDVFKNEENFIIKGKPKNSN